MSYVTARIIVAGVFALAFLAVTGCGTGDLSTEGSSNSTPQGSTDISGASNTSTAGNSNSTPPGSTDIPAASDASAAGNSNTQEGTGDKAEPVPADFGGGGRIVILGEGGDPDPSAPPPPDLGSAAGSGLAPDLDASPYQQPTGPIYSLAYAVGAGSVALNPPGGDYVSGTVVHARFTPPEGAEFVGVRWDDCTHGGDNPAQVTLARNMSGSLVWSEPSKYYIRIRSCKVALDPPGGVYEPGTEVRVTILPYRGLIFRYVLWEDGSRTTTREFTLTMDSNKIGETWCAQGATFIGGPPTGGPTPIDISVP